LIFENQFIRNLPFFCGAASGVQPSALFFVQKKWKEKTAGKKNKT